MLSRGIKESELLRNNEWWEGPQFLQLADTEWPSTVSNDISEEAQAEFVKKPPEVAHTFATSMFESSASSVVKVLM